MMDVVWTLPPHDDDVDEEEGPSQSHRQSAVYDHTIYVHSIHHAYVFLFLLQIWKKERDLSGINIFANIHTHT
jgi:hypothetical protein